MNYSGFALTQLLYTDFIKNFEAEYLLKFYIVCLIVKRIIIDKEYIPRTKMGGNSRKNK